MSGLSPTMLWAILGMVLLVLEIFTLSFGVMFFGVAALIVALLKLTVGLEHVPTEILLFAGLGVGALALFRKKLLAALQGFRGGSDGAAIDRAKQFVLTADLPARGSAKVEYQGVIWDAHNAGDTPLAKGTTVVILDTEGIKLIVRGV